MASTMFERPAAHPFEKQKTDAGSTFPHHQAFITPAQTPHSVRSSISNPDAASPSRRSSWDYNEDIAVVGMACRVAGDNDSPEKLWDFIINKGSASGEIPEMRWEPYYRRDARNAKELDQTTSRGYFVKDIENFDCSFFGVSPREAEQMDPQQRISLEVCWEALESAGIPPQSLAKSNTAVFMGVNSDDWSKLLLEDLSGIEAWMGIGTAFCGIPNRISYHLDLMGPSTAVDAACASSLVAIHHGRQSLLTGETDLAIVGGVNVMAGPGLVRVLDKAGAISSEGFCRSFDDEAQGYGRGEGASIIVLKRLGEAVRNRDRIHAVIKGTAVAQDGKTNGIMAPNGAAQELVAQTALNASNIDPKSIGYVEAHATSTPVGDPVEVGAIGSIYGKGRTDDPVYVGSIKPNIGHLEAGAGAMGFMKAVMAVDKGIIPPQTNLNKLNSKVDWEKIGVTIPKEPTEWKQPLDTPRRAGVASYGYGGTVSHAVIEEWVANAPMTPPGESASHDKNTILLLSAPQEKRLATQADVLARWFADEGRKDPLADIATTLSTRRGLFDNRAAFVVDSHEDAAAKLNAFAEGQSDNQVVSGRILGNKGQAGVVWVFSGHGAQWSDMGKELLMNSVFLDAVTSIDDIIREEMGWSAVEKLKSGSFEASDEIQVLTYAMHVGLAAVLTSNGVTPSAVVGHSIGEIAAAVVAGAITRQEGAIIVTRRAVLYRRVMGKGAMILVQKPYSEIQEELGQREDIAAAIDSSPSSCVVSGQKDVVARYETIWKDRGTRVLRVSSDVAFHSPVLNELVIPLEESLAGVLKPQNPSITLYSTSVANPRANEPRDTQYWVNNMTQPVLLKAAVNAAAEDDYHTFLEVSTHPIVSHSIDETFIARGSEDHAVIPTMMRNKPAEKNILTGVAKMYVRGVPISSSTAMPGPWSYDVPRTTWNHQPIWRKIETGPLNASTTHDVEKHNLLGMRTSVAGENIAVYTSRLDNDTKPFPGNHPLHGTEIVPAAVLVNTFIQGVGVRTISDIVLRVPVAISAPRDIQIVVGNGQTKITSRLIPAEGQNAEDTSWVTHTTGHFALEDESHQESPEKIDIAALKDSIKTQLASDFSIDYLDKVGVSAMGFPWKVTEHWGTTSEMIARVDVAPDVPEGKPLPWDEFSWSPIFDAATSVGSTLFFDQPRLRMPAQIKKVVVYTDAPPPKIGWLHVTKASGDFASSIDVCGEDGTVLARFDTMRFSEMEGTPGASGSVESLVHQLAWPPVLPAEEPLDISEVLIVSQSEDARQKHKSYFGNEKIVKTCARAEEISDQGVEAQKGKHAVIVYVPGTIGTNHTIAEAASEYCEELLSVVKSTSSMDIPAKVFVVTDNIAGSATPDALAQAPLQGLARIIASEHPDLWGALIDTDGSTSPRTTIKYMKDCEVVRVTDGIARVARLRPLPRNKVLPQPKHGSLLPRSEGTYLVTGGLGALGIEVANFLVEKGARRVVLLSRRALPPRKDWDSATDSLGPTIASIQALEAQGATVHTLSVDIAAVDAAEQLSVALEALDLPPVRGVVHAAGITQDQMVMSTTRDSFDRVLAPKVNGALALHELFPPKSLDFFMLFSSCGQLFGFPGQASYASGNAFLDTLASHRRLQGDNAIALQWTSWRGMGMAASTDFISAELESRGITDVTRDEAFLAWMHIDKYDMDNAVVLRSRAFDANEPLPVPILEDIAVRRAPSGDSDTPTASADTDDSIPANGPELKAYLENAIKGCVAVTLGMPVEDVESRTALSDIGLDSVMTVTLRRDLQTKLKVKVPPTLTWSHPTVNHLVGWYTEKLQKA